MLFIRDSDIMAENKARLVKKYRGLLKKSDVKESEVVEMGHKLSEDARESQEELDIGEEEDAGEEPYFKIEEDLRHENSNKEDEE